MLSLSKFLKISLDWIFWIFLLIFMSLIIPIQIIIMIMFILYYTIYFIFYLIYFKITKNKNLIIKYNKNPPSKNYIFIFFYFFFWDLPKKKAFFFFYNFIKFTYLTKNKSAIFKIFSNFKVLSHFLKNFLIIFLVKFITNFSLISIKNTNFVFSKIKNVKLENHLTFKSFLSSSIFNLIISYNELENQIVDYKIIIDENIVLNPLFNNFSNKTDFSKIYFNFLKEKNLIFTGANDFQNQGLISLSRYGTSQPLINSKIILNEEYSVNTCLVDIKHISKDFYKLNNEYILKDDPYLSKLNQHYIWNTAGYDENKDFYDSLKNNNVNIPKSKEELDSIINKDPLSIVRIKAHLVNNSSQEAVSMEDFVWNYNRYSHLRTQLARDLILNWNTPCLEYSLKENNNLFFYKKKQTLGEYLIEKKHTFISSDLKFSIDCVSNFFELNSQNLKNLNELELKNVLSHIVVKNNVITTTLFKGTSFYEKQSQHMKDIIDELNIAKNTDFYSSNYIFDLNKYISDIIDKIN